MSELRRVGDLELGQDLAYQRREWLFERIGWASLVLVVVAALAGLFGGGPLSRRERATSGDALRIEYEQFIRRKAEATLTVHLGGSPDGPVRVWIDGDYPGAVESKEIAPRPDRVEVGDGRHTFVFPHAGSGGEVTIRFRFAPDRAGTLRGRVGVGSHSVELSQFVYP